MTTPTTHPSARSTARPASRPTAHAGPRRPRGGRSAAALTGAALAALLLTGCGAQTTDHGAGHGSGHTSDTATEGAADHGEADTAFASGMVVHHEGALTMAQDAAQRASTPEVRALAERVVAAQQPEIDQMEGWLTAWGEDGGSHAGHDMAGTSGMAGMAGTGGMAGMAGTGGMAGMSGDDTAALAAATGTAYDRLFLEQMTAHHRDAVEMAQREQAEGTAPEAVALAERIEADQTAEIAEMAGLLQQLGA